MATQLVPLQEVERISARVIRILGGNPGKVSPAFIASSPTRPNRLPYISWTGVESRRSGPWDSFEYEQEVRVTAVLNTCVLSCSVSPALNIN